MSNVSCRVQEITPVVATRLLKDNTGNRKVSQTHVATLSSEMTKGRWVMNGDPIRLAGKKLIDGQHRSGPAPGG